MKMTNVYQLMSRVHSLIAEPKAQPDVMCNPSMRESIEDNDLRELLRLFHVDTSFAQFVEQARVSGYCLYDPDPADECNWYLSLSANAGKVDFLYQQSNWGVGRGGETIPFELKESRFYAQAYSHPLGENNAKVELLDLFPNLTCSNLEKGIAKYIRENKK